MVVSPIRLVKAGSPADLSQVMKAEGWAEAVVKPAISADAADTRRVKVGAARAHAPWFKELAVARDVLVQPFVPAILEGEWSFVFFAGAFSHAVLKRPAPGEWRVQPRLGVVTSIVEPSTAQLAFARKAVAAAPACLYARVDAVFTADGPLLMELELIEPYLFLDLAPASAARFAKAIAASEPGLRARMA